MRRGDLAVAETGSAAETTRLGSWSQRALHLARFSILLWLVDFALSIGSQLTLTNTPSRTMILLVISVVLESIAATLLAAAFCLASKKRVAILLPIVAVVAALLDGMVRIRALSDPSGIVPDYPQANVTWIGSAIVIWLYHLMIVALLILSNRRSLVIFTVLSIVVCLLGMIYIEVIGDDELAAAFFLLLFGLIALSATLNIAAFLEVGRFISKGRGEMHWLLRAIVSVIAGVLAPLSINCVVSLFGFDGFGVFFQIGLLILMLFTAASAVLIWEVLAKYCSTPPHRETRCRKCGYILRGLSEARCSECGEAI
jgi:hypothetical protein